MARCVTVATGIPKSSRVSRSAGASAGEATTYPAASSRERSVENVPSVSTSAPGDSAASGGCGDMR